MSLNENTSIEDIYKKVDELPTSISNLIKPKLNFDSIKSIFISITAMNNYWHLILFSKS